MCINCGFTNLADTVERLEMIECLLSCNTTFASKLGHQKLQTLRKFFFQNDLTLIGHRESEVSSQVSWKAYSGLFPAVVGEKSLLGHVSIRQTSIQ
jgi:hypothetical protein